MVRVAENGVIKYRVKLPDDVVERLSVDRTSQARTSVQGKDIGNSRNAKQGSTIDGCSKPNGFEKLTRQASNWSRSSLASSCRGKVKLKSLRLSMKNQSRLGVPPIACPVNNEIAEE